MRLINICRLRVRSLLHRATVEDELSAELAFHLEQQIAENIASGMAPQEARDAALRTLGRLDSFKEECRDVRRMEWTTALVRDGRYAARTLMQDRGFTAVAVLSLALGIGVNTALFSVVDAVMLKSLPVAEPERLVVIDRVNPQGEKDNFLPTVPGDSGAGASLCRRIRGTARNGPCGGDAAEERDHD